MSSVPQRTMLWLFLMLATGSAVESIDLDYSEISLTGIKDTCPLLDSCRTFPALYNHTHLRTRNCECDVQCDLYRDCCIDAPILHKLENRLRPTPPPPLFCMEIGDREGVYAVKSCPLWYTGELKSFCENGDGGADPLLSAPFTAKDGTTYWNRYCARCNEVDQGVVWPLRLDCPVNATWEEVQFQPDGSWGVRGVRCELHFQPPPGLRFRRRCRATQIGSCPSNNRRSFEEKACAYYMSEVVDQDMTVFRNVHCAQCNGRRGEDLLCAVPSDMGRRIKKPFSFALLLDVNANDGDLVGATAEECPTGFMYDPFFKKCRETTCAIPGFKLKKNKCVKQ